jgi:gliding motility-associated-like protein/uncharacterized repeat protein (TIGR02059 family)
MRCRIMLAALLLSLATLAEGQVETVYNATVIKAGPANIIGLAEDGPFAIPFTFTFFGNSYTSFWVSDNGLVMFGDPAAQYNTSAPIPTAAAPNNYIAAFWDTLKIDGTGKILYTTIGTAPNRKTVIQYRNMGFYPDPVYMGTFSVILYETSNDIQVQYRQIVDSREGKSRGADATIGLENSDGSAGVQYAYRNSAAITSKQAIRFTPSGGTYNINGSAIFEGIYLTTNTSLPEPGIPVMVSPANDATVGTTVNFEWEAASNASSYSLLLSNNADLSNYTLYTPGTATTFQVTGLTDNTTYYWGVFAQNTTGLTWCEIKKFKTSSAPPLTAVTQTKWVEQNNDVTVKLSYTGGDGGAKSAFISTLPSTGKLYQYSLGTRGAEITSTPAAVTDPMYNVIYSASGSFGNGAGNFGHIFHDGTGDSPEATITVNITPPGAPILSYTARSQGVELIFDRAMTSPAGKEGEFTVTVDGTPVTVTAAALKTGDNQTIVLTLPSPLSGSETVTVSYTKGSVVSQSLAPLESFSAQTVTLLAQTISFSPLPTKRYLDPPFYPVPAITTSSGLGFTLSSSNTSVATVSGVWITITGPGNANITATQAGNGTYAPARYTQPLSVLGAVQSITFNTPGPKTYGDPDFTLAATATSGLAVTFTSDDPAVAVITGNTVHITGAGDAVITASQAGDFYWSAAPDVQRTLTVNKADQVITFNPLPGKTFGDSPFDLTAVSSSGLAVTFASENNEVATVTGNTATITGAGSTNIVASQAGSTNYNPAPAISQPLSVSKASQTVTFTSVPDKILITLTSNLVAEAESDAVIVFESLNPEIASVSGNTLTALSKGVATIKALSPGDNNYLPAEATAEVEIVSSHRDIMNLFTPNGDGINDYWELPEMEEWGKCDVKVFTRNGQLIFSDPDYNNLWDGTSDGKQVPEGVYYYIIKTENSGIKKGSVNILR